MTHEKIRADSQTQSYTEYEKKETPNYRSEGLSFPGSEDAEGEPKYHLQVVDYTNGHLAENPARRARFQSRIDTFLEDLFTVGQTDLAPDYVCPLVYSNHVVETITQTSGIQKKVLKILFTVSQETNKTLNQAAAEFCNKVFSKEGQPLLFNLTTAKIFGLSPVPGTIFKQLWNSAFFLRTIENGGQNLRWLFESHRDSMIIPDWLSTSCFAFSASASFNFGAWAARTLADCVGIDTITELALFPRVMTAAQLTAAGLVVWEVSRAFLEIRARGNAARDADAKFKATGWKIKLQRFIASVDSILRLLNERHIEQIHSHTDDARLGDELLCVMELAAEMFTTNQQAFEIYDSIRKESESKFATGLALSAAYLGASGVFAGLAQVTLTTVTVAPIAIAEMGTLTALGVTLGLVEAPVVATVTTSALFTPAAPIAVAAIVASFIWAGLSIDSLLDKRKYEKKVKCLVGVNNLVFEIWTLADDTYNLLSWIHCADQAEPEFVSEDTRIAWIEWIERVRRKSNAIPTWQDYSGQGLKNYLHERARDIIRWKVDVNKLIEEFE